MAIEKSLRLGVDSRGARQGAAEAVRSLDDIRKAAGRATDGVDKTEKGMLTLNRAASALTGVTRLATAALGAFGVTVGVAGLVRGIGAANRAMDNLTDSVRRLNAASRTSGISLGTLQNIAKQAGADFLLTTAESNDYGQAIGRLVERTGDLKRSQEALRAVMVLAANEGLDAADAIGTFESALRGSDEATEKLFAGAQPSAIYAAYAAAVGKTADSLTLADKSLAVFNVAIERAARIGGTFTGALTELERAQRQANRELDLAKVALGEAFAPSRVDLINAQAEAFRALADVFTENRDGIREISGAFVRAIELGGKFASVLETIEDFKITRGGGLFIVTRERDVGDVLGAGSNRPAGFASRPAESDLITRTRERLAREEAERSRKAAAALQARIAAEEAEEEAAKRLAKASDKAAKEVDRIFASISGSLGGRGMPTANVTGLTARLVGNVSRVEQERADRMARLEALGGVTRFITPPGATYRNPSTTETTDATRAITDGVRGVIDLGDAVGILGDQSRRALGGVTNLVSAVDTFRNASGAIGKIGAGLGIAGAAAGLAVGLISALTSESPEQKALREQMRRNTDALEDLRLAMSGFVLDVNTLRRLQGGLPGLQDAAGPWAAIGGSVLQEILKATGLTEAELRALDDAITTIDLFDEKGRLVVGALDEMAEAIDLQIKRLFSFGDALDGQRAKQSALDEIFDRNTPQDALNSQYGLLSQFAPDILRMFGGANLNVGTEAGRSALEQALREAITAYANGTLDPALLGQFENGQQFVDLLLGTDTALDAFTEGLNQATSAVTDIPRAVNIALFRAGVTASAGPVGPTTGTGLPESRRDALGGALGSLTLQIGTFVNQAGDTPEVVARKLERGAQILARQGVKLHIPGAVVTQ